MPLAPGRRLGPYEIVSPLGAGGMGEVYRARDTRLSRDVAVKVLPRELASDPDRRARFEREAQAISALSHPHVCALFDVGTADSPEGPFEFLVMELLEGETLARRLERGPLPLPAALAVGAQVAQALGAAHRRGLVHRDLKPGNVMLTVTGAKLLDFGLARFDEGGAAVSPADARHRGGAAHGRGHDRRHVALPRARAAHRPRVRRAQRRVRTGRCLLRDADRPARVPRSDDGRGFRGDPRLRGPRPLPAAEDAARTDRGRRPTVPREGAPRPLAERGRRGRGFAARRGRAGGRRAGSASRAPSRLALAGLRRRALPARARGSRRPLAARRPLAEEPLRFVVPPPKAALLARPTMSCVVAAAPDGRRIAFVAITGGVTSLWLWSARGRRGAAAGGHGGRDGPVLLAGRPGDRLLRSRRAAANRRGRRPGHHDRQHAVGQRRLLVCGRHHPLHSLARPRSRALERIERRRGPDSARRCRPSSATCAASPSSCRTDATTCSSGAPSAAESVSARPAWPRSNGRSPRA